MVFISYKSEEREMAYRIKSTLESNGIECWMAPDSVTPGADFAYEIPNAIQNCDAFVLVLSAKAQKSNWIKSEIDEAFDAGKVIVPFKIDDSDIKTEFNFRLRTSQRIEAFNRLSDAFTQLVDRITILCAGNNNKSGNITSRNEESSTKKIDVEIEGNIIKFGSYPQNSKNIKEPIEWQILEKKDNKILVISRYLLDNMPYVENQGNFDASAFIWENCSIKKWLNNTFLNMAFSYDEQKKIIPTLNEPETSTIWDKCLYYLTPDSVFLLNRSEVNKYLKTTSEKKHIATKYAINEATLRNGPIDPGFYNTWFLRPQDRFPYDYSYIDENGIINYPLSSAEGNPFVGIMPYSVRPAMWISLE